VKKRDCRELTIISITILLGLKSSRTLSAKANRQKWPFIRKSHAGSPIHLYDLRFLPDDIQIAWAQWDDQKFQKATRIERQKGDDGRVDQIPKVENAQSISEVLRLPERRAYYKSRDSHLTSDRKGAPVKVYDGSSAGLCNEAREILQKRLSELEREEASFNTEISPLNAGCHDDNTLSFREQSERYTLNASTTDSLLALLREKERMTQKLESEIADLRQDKAFLKGFIKELKTDNENLVREKEGRLQDKDRLIVVLEETIKELRSRL
jgi:cell division protein FtsB